MAIYILYNPYISEQFFIPNKTANNRLLDPFVGGDLRDIDMMGCCR